MLTKACPPIPYNADAIRSHVDMLHKLAAGYDGILPLAVYGENPDNGRKIAIVQHFRVGDVDGMTAAALAYENHPDANVYAPLAVMRQSLARREKGSERDVIAVLGAVADSDADDGREARPPVQFNYEVETSAVPAPNRQGFILFDRALAPADAKPLLEALYHASGGDHGTRDMSHVWRIPGTANWPNKKKVSERNRPREPQPVRVTQPWDGDLTNVDELRAALAAHMAPPRPNGKARGASLTGDVAAIMDGLGAGVRKLIIAPPIEGEDRSRTLASVITSMIRSDLSDGEIAAVIEAHPDGVGEKYVERPDLAAEIARLRKKFGAKPRDMFAEDDISPAHSDEALALSFAERYANELRYVAAWGRWLCWNDACWRFDETLHAFDLARHVCRKVAKEANKPSVQTAVASAKTVAAVERLAKADRRLAATIDQWDANPWLINTPGGVIDLRTGKVRPARIDDYCTKITAVAPGDDCPTWKAFLQRVTGGNADLIAFLRRVCGYALTGVTREHALFFLFGTGANGKSVFISTVAGILADYHTTAAIETFTASQSERHPTDLAGLRGARLVTSIETEEGRRWAESKIKALTGGDKIAARFMRQDFFEFVPAFKLMIAGNHKPGLRSVDEAIRRRLHLIPFNVTIPPAERDLELAEKLKAEWPGILAWMVDGCLEWQAIGLKPPTAVTKATAAYLEAEDAIAAWLDECCLRDPQAWESRAALFASWTAWATKAGEIVGSQKQFVQILEARGFTPQRRHDGRGFAGLGIVPGRAQMRPPAEDELEAIDTDGSADAGVVDSFLVG